MAGLVGTGARPPVVNVYHEKSRILPDVSRVLACLYEKDVKFETIKASYKDLLSLQASRSVPVPFYDGPVFLQDSRAICRYIAETYEHEGCPFLLGKDVLERASIEQWLRHEEHAFDPPSRALFCHLAFPPQCEDNGDHEDINQEIRKLEEVLEVYEQRLGETKFLAGNKFTLADLVHLPGTHHAITSDRFAYLYDSRKNVQRWWNQISARGSWQQVLSDMKTVEEQHQLQLEKQQELEEQQKQKWLTATSSTFGGCDIHIDPRKQEGTKPTTVVIAPPSIGTFSTPPASRDRGTTSDKKPSSPSKKKQGAITEQPPPPLRQTELTTQKSPLSDNTIKSNFFTIASTPTEKPLPPSRPTDPTTQKTTSSVNGTKSTFTPSAPSSAKTRQQTDDEKPSNKTDLPSPRKTSQRSPKEAADKPHPSDFFKASGHKDEAGTLAKPSSQDSSNIPRVTDKTPDKINEHNAKETKSKPTGVSPPVDKPVPLAYTTPDRQTPQTSYVKPPEQGDTETSLGLEPGQELKSAVGSAYTPSNGDTPEVIEDDNRFSTKRLQNLFNPDIEDSQYPSRQEEAPADPKKHSDVHDKEKQTTMIPDSGKSGCSPSPNMRAPHAPVTDEERSAILPPKGPAATTGAEKSPPNQQVLHPAPSTDKLPKTASVNTGRPQGTTPKAPIDDKNGFTSDEPSEKSSTVSKKVLEATPRKTPPDENLSTSAPVEEVTLDASVKQVPADREILDVQGTGDSDSTQKTVVDKRAAEPSSRQTTESDKGAVHTLQGITGDESTKAAQSAPEKAPASSEQNMPTVSRGDVIDTNGKEAITSSPGDPRGTIPATQRPSASGIMSAQSSELLLSDKGGEKTVFAETSQTRTEAPNENLDRQIPRNTGESSSGTSPVKSQENGNETYKEQNDQSGGKLIENGMRQGNDVASNAKTGKRKEDGYIANVNNNNNERAQATTDAPSKLQIQSGKNKPETSNDGDMGINETENTRILETSREVQPSSPEKSMGQKQLQENKPAISQQGNAKKSTDDAPPLGSGTEQQKKDDLPTEEDKNNGKASEVK